MKIDLKDIHLIFERMQEEVNISYVSIVIFAAVDLDSLCTLKIFCKMFKCENIQYKVYPVTTYSQLGARIEESKAYDKVKMFLFINCGGIIDLTDYWIIQQKQAQIFLFDVNRPIHHKNLQSEDIKIIDDGHSQFEYCPTSQQIEKYQQLNEYDLDDDDQDDDEEVSRAQDSPKRIKKRQFREKLRKHKDLIQEKITKYYGTHFCGYPSSYSAYRLIRDLHKENNDYLWYAIVGLTSMYLEHKINKEMLDFVSQLYRHDVTKFNASGYKRDKGDIAVRKGYQFVLLDQWSLYQSMLHSNYMMIKLHLWEEKGISRLNQFIHTLEISLQEAKQLFKYMSREAQQKLQNNIIPTAQKFGLHEVVYISFVRQVDYADSFSASDYYYVLTSILEAPPKIQIPFQQLPEHRIDRFWQAYDAFDSNIKTLSQRIQECKRTVKIMVTQTKNILQRDHLITMPRFCIANIKNDTDDRKIFEHPSTLIRLAYLLMGILREKRKNKGGYKPFIANWIDMQKDVCLLVGVMMDSKNSIGHRFNEVAQELKIEVNHDNFMANIILMKKDHLSSFLKAIGQ